MIEKVLLLTLAIQPNGGFLAKILNCPTNLFDSTRIYNILTRGVERNVGVLIVKGPYMNRRILITGIALLLGVVQTVDADVAEWQNEVATGTAAAATNFSTVSGSSPITFDVGALSRGRSFEFILNAGSTGDTQTLLGDFTNGQALKFEQWQDTGNYGITNFGVTDFDSGEAHTANQNIHLVFKSSGSSTEIWVDGINVTEISTALSISGVTGLAGAWNATTNEFLAVENLNGSIFGFASYDTELADDEIIAHAEAFAIVSVPEPSSMGLIAITGLVFITRRKTA